MANCCRTRPATFVQGAPGADRNPLLVPPPDRNVKPDPIARRPEKTTKAGKTGAGKDGPAAKARGFADRGGLPPQGIRYIPCRGQFHRRCAAFPAAGSFTARVLLLRPQMFFPAEMSASLALYRRRTCACGILLMAFPLTRRFRQRPKLSSAAVGGSGRTRPHGARHDAAVRNARALFPSRQLRPERSLATSELRSLRRFPLRRL